MRHGAIADNIINNLSAKFNDDRLWNENVLVHWKFGNNNPKNNNNDNVGSAWGPVSGSNNSGVSKTGIDDSSF